MCPPVSRHKTLVPPLSLSHCWVWHHRGQIIILLFVCFTFIQPPVDKSGQGLEKGERGKRSLPTCLVGKGCPPASRTVRSSWWTWWWLAVNLYTKYWCCFHQAPVLLPLLLLIIHCVLYVIMSDMSRQFQMIFKAWYFISDALFTRFKW